MTENPFHDKKKYMFYLTEMYTYKWKSRTNIWKKIVIENTVIDGWTDDLMDGQMDEWRDGWTRRMDG